MINEILYPPGVQVPVTYDYSYLNKFTDTYLDWKNWSNDLERDFQRLKCRTSLNSFKSVFTDSLPRYSCKFSIRILRGSNFKIGISESTNCCENAFSDLPGGMAFYSMAQLRNGSASQGKHYGTPYRANDLVTVYVDRQLGCVFFAVNDAMFEKAFEIDADRDYYGAVACLTKGEWFEMVQPEMED
jgi:hypothetical protein